jgi:hypothetical protein
MGHADTDMTNNYIKMTEDTFRLAAKTLNGTVTGSAM